MRSLRTPLITLALLSLAPPAYGYDFEVYAETVGQGYQLRAASDALVNRRRLSQQLGLSIYNIGPSDVVGRPLDRNQLYVSASMRFDADFGDYPGLPEVSGRTPERELVPAAFELTWAYLGGRNLGGFLDFKLGRQLQIDLFEWRAFDGLSVEARTPIYIAVEAWAGLDVSGASFLDSPIYRADGVALGGNTIGSLAAREEDALRPTFGVAAHSIGYRDLVARIAYARTISYTGARQPGEPGSGVVDESVAFTARGRLLHGLVHPWFGFRYSVLTGRLDEVQAGARLRLPKEQALQAEYVLSAPTFDGDSIWNVFASQPFNDVRVGWDGALAQLRLYARGFARLFGAATTSGFVGVGGASNPGVDPERVAGLPTGVAWGASLGARVDSPRGHARLDGFYEDGYGGLTAGVDLSGLVRIAGDLRTGLVGEGRVSYLHFRDDSRPIDHADSLGLQAGLRYTFVQGLTGHLLVEENVNRIYTSQLRVIGVLDLSFWLGPRGEGFVRQRTTAGPF
jgi:hypothetical protein